MSIIIGSIVIPFTPTTRSSPYFSHLKSCDRHSRRAFLCDSSSLTKKGIFKRARDHDVNNGCILAGKSAESLRVEDDYRPLGHFPPDIWGHRFDYFTLQDNLKMERYAEEVEPLKEEVREMLLDESADLLKKINLIDEVERLGFSYYYENEIKELLDHFFKQLREHNNFDLDYDLCQTALLFRIFRQSGYYMPCDVFNKFTDGEGKFRETLKSDEKGMLSLYEAAQLRVHEEEILEEALVFTTDFLDSIASFSEQACHSLKWPLLRSVQWLQAQRFISIYEQDESHNHKLVQLAKVEFNRLQLLYCRELSQIQQWCKKIDFAGKFPYMRQRMVENHFAALAICYEQQYSYARILLSKILTLITLLDDTFDSYATLEEIQLLTDAFVRWDLDSIEQLPQDYMKHVCATVFYTCEEFATDMINTGKSFASQYLKEQLQIVIRNYLIEGTWLATRYRPTFEEYMMNRRATGYAGVSMTIALMGTDWVTQVKPFEQLMHLDFKARTATANICGLLDDLATGEDEIKRGSRFVTSIECYMKENNMSREAALQALKKIIDDEWKDLIYEGLQFNNSDPVSKRLLELMVNYARATIFYFSVGDGYTSLDFGSIKEDLIATYAKPFP